MDYSTPGSEAHKAYIAMTENIEKEYALGVVLIASEPGYQYVAPWFGFGKNFWSHAKDDTRKQNITDLILLIKAFSRLKLLKEIQEKSANFPDAGAAAQLFRESAENVLRGDLRQAYPAIEHFYESDHSPELHKKSLMQITFCEALKVARRMSVYTLEGVEFDTTVILSADPAAHSMKDKLISELDYGTFNLENSSSVRDLLEACQGSGLYLVVDSRTGKMLSINKRTDMKAEETYLKIHIKSNARVDVLHGEEILLLWDGFEWALPKTAGLKKLIKKNEAIKDLVSACDSLLGKSKSAIIILLDKADSEKLDTVAGNVLRPLLYGTTAYYHGGNVKDLVKNDSLAALLGLDGAHVIDAETGNVQWLCMRLASGDDDIVIRTENVEEGEKNYFKNLIGGCAEGEGNLMISGLILKTVFERIVQYLKQQDNTIALQLRSHMSLQLSGNKLLLRFRCMATAEYDDPDKQWSVKKDGSGFYWFQGNVEEIDSILPAVLSHSLFSLHAALREWVRNRTIPTRENEGTGTRSAKFVSKKLPSSLVVKISASNSVKVYKNGSQLDA
jgi:hypothetical protein